MKKIHIFFINAAVLTATSLLIQTVMLIFNGYISKQIGTEGIGLYHLVMSVYAVAVTFATSGIGLAVTRLIAQDKSSKANIVKTAAVYGIIFGTAAFAILFFGAEKIAKNILNDLRAATALKTLSLTMPLIAISAIFNGYFTGARKTVKPAFVQIIETTVKIIATIFILSFVKNKGIKHSCAAVFAGSAVGEAVSFILMFILYDGGIGKFNGKVFSKLISTAMPVAVSTYIRSGLNTVKHITIPKAMQNYGMSYKNALSSYGTVNGIVMPIISFPMNILYSCSNLLVPEIAECVATGNNCRIKRIVKKGLKTTAVFAVTVFIICIMFSSAISKAVYGTAEYGRIIFIMAPIVLTMYTDAVCDGMLKGLNLQIYSMKVNIADCLMCIVLIPILVTRAGLYGYIAIIYLSEIINTTLSIKKLLRVVSKL